MGVNPQSSQGHAGSGTTASKSEIVLTETSQSSQGHAGAGTTVIQSGIVLGSQSTIFPRTRRIGNHGNQARNCPWESIHNPPKDTREPEPQQSSQELSLGVNPQSPKDTRDREPRQSSQELSLGVNPQSSQGQAGAGTTVIQSGIVLGSQSTIPPRTRGSRNHSNPVRNCPWESIHNLPKNTQDREPQQSSSVSIPTPKRKRRKRTA